MHIFLIFAKTMGTLFFLGLDLLFFIGCAEADTLGTRGPTFNQYMVLIVLLACAIGIWFL